jgi:hypothetical protein
MTREGTHALVERHYALKMAFPRQVGVGGVPDPHSLTSLPSFPTKKTKSILDYHPSYLREDCHCTTFSFPHWRISCMTGIDGGDTDNAEIRRRS